MLSWRSVNLHRSILAAFLLLQLTFADHIDAAEVIIKMLLSLALPESSILVPGIVMLDQPRPHYSACLGERVRRQTANWAGLGMVVHTTEMGEPHLCPFLSSKCFALRSPFGSASL